MAPPNRDRLHGTLDALILKTLSRGPRHGYAIARWLEETTRDALTIEEGSLYPALYRMEKRGWIEAAWGKTDSGRRVRYYRLTAKGRRHLEAETAEWSEFVGVVASVLRAT